MHAIMRIACKCEVDRGGIKRDDMSSTTESSAVGNYLNTSSDNVQLLKEKIDYLEKSLPDILHDHLLWRGCSQMSCGVVRPHVVTNGNHVYVGGGNSAKMEFTRTVMKYDTIANKWSCLPITAYYTFSMTVIDGLVTIIGGSSVVTACVCDTLTSYEERSNKWGSKFPPMPTKRCATSSVSSSNYVVVVGGIAEDDSGYLDVVEALDTSSMTWSTVCPFPMSVTFMSITACDLTGRIYLLGGLSQDHGAMCSIFSCSLSDLIASANQTDTKEKKENNIWKIITKSPYLRSGGAAIGGKLVIASGLGDSGDVTNTVHSFDPETEQWTELGEMPSARSSCSIASLPGGQLLIVGGYFKPKNWVGSLTRDVMATVNLTL